MGGRNASPGPSSAALEDALQQDGSQVGVAGTETGIPNWMQVSQADNLRHCAIPIPH